MRGDHLVAKVKAVVDRSVIKLSTLKQSLHLQHYKVDHTDLMEALQVADIIEIDCKVYCNSSNGHYNSNYPIIILAMGIIILIILAMGIIILIILAMGIIILIILL